MTVKSLIFIILTSVLLALPQPTMAGLGVGVSSGKIVLNEPLKTGTSSQLPGITVINTGDITSRYELGISRMEGQTELSPQPFWFSYNPPSFDLAPGEAQPVQITLTIPLKTVPGQYFALVEAHPVLTDNSGTQIGIAAATKLYFDIQSESLIASIYYRGKTVWDQYSPYNYYLLVTLILLTLAIFLSKRFHITVSKKHHSAQ